MSKAASNAARARAAAKAVAANFVAREHRRIGLRAVKSDESHLVDALTNLRHFAARQGWDVDHLWELATMHCDMELTEEAEELAATGRKKGGE